MKVEGIYLLNPPSSSSEKNNHQPYVLQINCLEPATDQCRCGNGKTFQSKTREILYAVNVPEVLGALEGILQFKIK